MDVLQLILAAVSPTLNFVGSGAAVYLYGTGRILTRGMHLDRVADITKNYEAQLAEKDRNHTEVMTAAAAATSELRESLHLAQTTAGEERARADQATNQLAALAAQVTRVVTIPLDTKAPTS